MPFNGFISVEEQGRHTAGEAVGAILQEANSLAAMPGVIERFMASMRAEFARTDWALYKDAFGSPPIRLVDSDLLNDSAAILEKQLPAFQKLIEGIQQSTEIILYEGLPERDDATYFHEWTTQNTVVLQQSRFYAEPLALQTEDAVNLTSLCCDPHNFSLNSLASSRMFHTDYSLEWRSPHGVIRFFFNFNYRGVFCFHDGSPKLIIRMEQEPFGSILSAYRKNLPYEAVTWKDRWANGFPNFDSRSFEEQLRQGMAWALDPVVNESASVDDISKVTERLFAAMQTELTQTDWALYGDSFGVEQPEMRVIQEDEWESMLFRPEKYLPEFQALVEGIRQSTEVVLYEGLPHRHEATYYREWSTKHTLIMHGYRFYAEPLPLQKEDAIKLTELCCDPSNFALDGTHSLCMFHADYCLEWGSGQETTQIQLCFSCHDVAGYRGSTHLLVPMSSGPFESILLKYPQNRPA